MQLQLQKAGITIKPALTQDKALVQAGKITLSAPFWFESNVASSNWLKLMKGILK